MAGAEPAGARRRVPPVLEKRSSHNSIIGCFRRLGPRPTASGCLAVPGHTLHSTRPGL